MISVFTSLRSLTGHFLLSLVPAFAKDSFTAPKTLKGYEDYKEHWFREHANEQEMAVRKVKYPYGDAYYISVDLTTKGGKLIEHLVRLDIHRFDDLREKYITEKIA